MSDIRENILLILNYRVANQNDFCRLLGYEWEDLKEEIGMLHVAGWIEKLPFTAIEIDRSPCNQAWRLTVEGRVEVHNRIADGKKKTHTCCFVLDNKYKKYNVCTRCNKFLNVNDIPINRTRNS